MTRVSAGQQLNIGEREAEPVGEKAAQFLIGRSLGGRSSDANLERVTVPSGKFGERGLRLGVNQQNSSLVRFVGSLM